MGLNILTLGSSKTYTNLVALGISSMRVQDTTVYFTIAQTGEEVSVTLPTPKDGISIESVEIDENNHLICTMSDASTVDAGELPSYEPVLTEALSPNVTMGSLKTSYPVGTSLEEIIRDMLTEKIPPVTTMTLSPSTLLYDEVNGSIPSLTINATITKKTNGIAKVEFYINNTLVHTVSSGMASGGSVPYIYNTVINDDTEVKVVTTDTEGLSSTAKKTITFIGNSYYGIVEPTLSDATEAIVKTLNKSLKNTKKFLYSGINCDYNKIVYAYPSELGKLTSIMDKVNNFNYTSSFQLSTKTIDGIEYYVYLLIDPTGAVNVELTFE